MQHKGILSVKVAEVLLYSSCGHVFMKKHSCAAHLKHMLADCALMKPMYNSSMQAMLPLEQMQQQRANSIHLILHQHQYGVQLEGRGSIVALHCCECIAVSEAISLNKPTDGMVCDHIVTTYIKFGNPPLFTDGSA